MLGINPRCQEDGVGLPEIFSGAEGQSVSVEEVVVCTCMDGCTSTDRGLLLSR